MTRAVTCPVVSIDHHSPEFAASRHEIFSRLRRETPIVLSDHYGGFFVVTNYAHGRQVLRDDEHFAVRRYEDGTGGLLIPPVMKAPPLRPGELDGAEHLAYRKALHDKFKAGAVAELEGFVQGIVDDTLASAAAKGSFDVVADVASVIPARVILEYLGLPPGEHAAFLEGLALGFRAAPDPDEAADDDARFRESWRAMLQVIVEKRRNPGANVISHLAQHELGLNDEELLSVALNLALGGTLTTMAWMSYATMVLEQDRALRERLIREPDLIPQFGEEVLRFFSPAASLARNVVREVELGGVLMRPGDRVYVAIASLNRDEEVFVDAARFDIDRERKQHMAFGVGAHFCVGVHLARLEFRLYVRSLLERMPDFTIDESRSEHNQAAGVTPRWLTLPATAGTVPA